MKYPRDHQRALGVEQPVSVLWATLRERLTPEEVRQVEAAYRAQSRRYQRACELNKMARWVERNSSRALRQDDQAKLERRRAALAEPMKYIEGE